MRNRSRKIALVLALCTTLLTSGCATTHSGGGAPLRAGLRYEAEIGEQIHAKIMSSFAPYTEPRLGSYVQKVGYSLTAFANRKLPYRFIILQSDKVYATSAPGGYVYLTTAMLYFLENESQLAAVLAHEIGELQFQDYKVNTTQKNLETATYITAHLAPLFGPIGMLAAAGLATACAVGNYKNLPPAQKLAAADKHALHSMVRAGYDPQGLLDLVYKFSQKTPETLPYFTDYLTSRPFAESRIAALEKNFDKLPLEGRRFEAHRNTFLEATKGIRQIYSLA